MGMYDSIFCRYPLPGLGVVDVEFQTKDTPSQFLDTYEIRADGTLWRQDYDTVDRSDPSATGLGRLCGSMARENLRWVRDHLTGTIGFYGDHQGRDFEFEADFAKGEMCAIRAISGEAGGHHPRFRITPKYLDSIRAGERQACVQIVLDHAEEAMAAGDTTLALTLQALAIRMKE